MYLMTVHHQGAEKSVIETLQNRTKPLKLGYIMVKNRSEKDIQGGVSLRFH